MSRRLLVALCIIFWNLPVHALDLGLTLGSNSEYNNNATFNREDKQEEVEQIFSLDVSAVETRKNFELNTAVSLERRSYLNGVFEDETSVSTGVGVLNFNLIESLLTWETSYNRSEELDDPFGPQVEENLDRRDTFETGPTLFYVISEIDRVTFSSRYINAENSDPSLADTERSNSQLAYFRYLSPLTEANISLGYEDIIKPDGGRNYDKYSASLGLTRQISGGSLALSAGVSRLEDEAGPEETSNTYSFLLQKQNVLAHSVLLSYNESLSDTSLGFAPVDVLVIEDDGSSTPTLVLVEESYEINSVVKRRVFGAGLSRDLATFDYSLSYSWENDEAVEVYDVSYSKSYSFELGTRITPSSRLSFNSELSKSSTKSLVTLTRNRSLSHTVGINHDATETFRISGSCSYNQQKDKDDQPTDAFSVNLGLVWTIL